MIRLYVGDQGIWNMDFKEGETAAEFVQRFKDTYGLHFKSGAALQNISDGRTVPENEIMLDRDYYLTAWLARA